MNSDSQEKKFDFEEVLLKKEVISENQLNIAKFESKLKANISIIDSIVHHGFATEIEILRSIAEEVGMDINNVFEGIIPFNRHIINFKFNLSKKISFERGQCIYDVIEEKKLVKIAIINASDPTYRILTKNYFEKIGYNVEFSITTKLSLSILQKRIYSNLDDYGEKILDIIVNNKDQGTGINDFITMIFEFAALEGASDVFINFESLEDSLTHVYFRINRKKQFKFLLPFKNAERLIQAIKQRSGMDAGKIRGHQDGSLEVNILEEKYLLSIRVSSITTVSGEQITLRIQMEDRKELNQLGFLEDHVLIIKDIIKSLKGIIVLSGVTGSGKTTTMYSMLSELDPDAYNIITMEDPVEIRVKNVNQVQINESAGQGFSQTIRAVLRQAPDAILLGEVRDAETASRAIEMALTGHLVLTTIHASNIDGIRDRLADLNVENIEVFIKAITLAVHQELVPDKKKGLRLKYEMATHGLTRRFNNDG